MTKKQKRLTELGINHCSIYLLVDRFMTLKAHHVEKQLVNVALKLQTYKNTQIIKDPHRLLLASGDSRSLVPERYPGSSGGVHGSCYGR